MRIAVRAVGDSVHALRKQGPSPECRESWSTLRTNASNALPKDPQVWQFRRMLPRTSRSPSLAPLEPAVLKGADDSLHFSGYGWHRDPVWKRWSRGQAIAPEAQDGQPALRFRLSDGSSHLSSSAQYQDGRVRVGQDVQCLAAHQQPREASAPVGSHHDEPGGAATPRACHA